MGYRSHKRKTRDSEKNLLQRNCAILRRFRLSIEEMGQLKKELERADKYLQEIAQRALGGGIFTGRENRSHKKRSRRKAQSPIGFDT